MANFGLSELRLVAPRDGWPNFQAQLLRPMRRILLIMRSFMVPQKRAVADLELFMPLAAGCEIWKKPVLTPRELYQP